MYAGHGDARLGVNRQRHVPLEPAIWRRHENLRNLRRDNPGKQRNQG